MEREGAVSRTLSYAEFCERLSMSGGVGGVGGAGGAGGVGGAARLEVRLGSRILPWRSAAPLLLSLLAYRRPLPSVRCFFFHFTFLYSTSFFTSSLFRI